MAEAPVEVVVQIAGADVLAGLLWSHRRRAAESMTFSYAPEYVGRPDAYELDPQLPLVTGQQQTPVDRAIFGAFSDCSPDRWGRRLIQQAERRRARAGAVAERSHGEIDFLLGGRDDLRQGALRFRVDGAYVAADDTGVPPLIELGRLLAAAERAERDEADDADLHALLHGGSTLGGARPKAHARDTNGRLAIAKFPSPANDDWEVMRWERVALALAGAAGVDVPRSHLHEIDGRAVLVVDRFDRDGDRRIGYVSAMTMLEAGDGDRGSYLDIADVIERHSPTARRDLAELWRRVAFSILVSNTDDHLRNHGFLRLDRAGWSLSPAFDVNPDPRPGPKHLSTAIDERTTAARLEPLMEVAGLFRLSDAEARTTLADVVAATSRWRETARRAGLGRAAIEQMAPAFEHEQAAAARALVGAR